MTDERVLLTARLAATRARVWRQLIGVDRHMLTASPVIGDWTTASLLAHIGEYDRLYARCTHLAAQGRMTKDTLIAYAPVNNATLRDRRGAWRLDKCVAFCEQARAEFLAALASASIEHFTTRQRFRWEGGQSQGSIRTWAQWRVLHDTTHAADLSKWLRREKIVPRTGPKSVLLAALNAATQDMQASAALVASDERESRPVCGRWTLKELLGHLADWDAYFLNWLNGMTGKPARDLPFIEDGDAFNAMLRHKRQRASFKRNYDDFVQNRGAFIEAVAATPERELVKPRDRSFPTIYHCAWSALEHYLDHASIMRRELAVPMPKALLHFKGPYT